MAEILQLSDQELETTGISTKDSGGTVEAMQGTDSDVSRGPGRARSHQHCEIKQMPPVGCLRQMGHNQ